jgi:signal transduction histidine kinase
LAASFTIHFFHFYQFKQLIAIVKKPRLLHTGSSFHYANHHVANKIPSMTIQKLYWRKIAFDAAWIFMLFFAVHTISSHYNFVDDYYSWARQYAQGVDIDELPSALLASLLGLLWFAKRRITESRQLIKKNQCLLQRILEVQEVQRKSIARDLHDDLGQYLSAIKAQAVSLLADNSAADTQQMAQRIIASADHAYAATHNLIRSLRPVGLDELGLSAALEHLVDSWRQPIFTDSINGALALPLSATDYELKIDGDIDVYSEKINIALFRIVQESLSNQAKHAYALRVMIHIEAKAAQITLTISDNGVGFDLSQQTTGFGLLGMAERVEALGGSFNISSRHDRTQAATGTQIIVQIGVNAA